MTHPDVVVVGAGIVGVCAAYELARAGASVTVLERGGGWGEECSWGNAGLLVPSHARPIAAPESLRAGLRWMVRRDSPFGLRPQPSLAPWLLRYARASTAARAAAGETLQRTLSVEGLKRFDELAAQGIDGGYRRSGLLAVHSSAQHARDEAGSETGRALGARLLTSAEARELEPALSGPLAAAVHFPDEAQCDPMRLIADVAAAAQRAGTEFRFGAHVDVVAQEAGGVRVGDVRAGHAVIAAGVWSGRLAASLGQGLPLVAGKGYAVDYAAAASPLRIPLYLFDARTVANPMGSRLRLTGGLVLGRGDRGGDDPRRLDAIRRVAATALGVTGTPQLEWAGLRPCTPDGLPIVGRHPRADRVVLATGHGMLGVTLGPLTGRLVTGLVAGTADHAALASLSADRF